MGYKHDRDEILDVAVDLVLDEGLAALTYGRVARRIPISDRTVVYYFPTKDDLGREVVARIGVRLQDLLESAFGAGPTSAATRHQRAWPLLTSPEGDRLFASLLEIAGGTVRASPSRPDLTGPLVEGWVEWLAMRIDPADPRAGRAAALATLAVVDGLLLLRHTGGRDLAEEAAEALGVRPVRDVDPSTPIR
ncbi:TetR/AcrR family transcriptional regulator [Iamia sp.]|uniref:TetR/AcrR family transcriptional regulator n=1 Tax=Iamia sp. TaxID=2722710 RepID=UPI002D1BA10D|nr:TetR/AcrR family transcriptional regulator [Iamia sp.]HXH55671.1 TetR/AcrR family transcriptional regulator [Iamia sp.]